MNGTVVFYCCRMYWEGKRLSVIAITALVSFAGINCIMLWTRSRTREAGLTGTQKRQLYLGAAVLLVGVLRFLLCLRQGPQNDLFGLSLSVSLVAFGVLALARLVTGKVK
jgi:hypothetical protein